MLKQLLAHCSKFNLIPDFQSDYRQNYSMETSLLRMLNDILWAMENQEITVVVILDLSAAFDTVDHDILLTVLKNHFGIDGEVIKWFENYLRPRYFKVCIDALLILKRAKMHHTTGVMYWGKYIHMLLCINNRHYTRHGFVDDHSIRKKYEASNKNQEIRTKIGWTQCT